MITQRGYARMKFWRRSGDAAGGPLSVDREWGAAGAAVTGYQLMVVGPCDLELNQRRSTGMNSGNQDKAEGTGKKAMGTAKEKTGEAIGNPDLRDRGTAEKGQGKVQDKVGDVKKVFEK